uniref:C-type lectin domain-containing protein n=1 Tax=Caenorhabditis tropicalis TaxID=1561998 RepID=A0A1I7TGV5_9PELO
MYEYFGIYCQDGKWYASKFPVGILYWTDVLESVYEDRGLEEKTAEISGIYCAPLPSIEQTTPKPVWTTPPPQCYCDSEEMLYTQLDGCRANVTCISDYSTLLIGYWGEVPKPDDALDGTYFTLETYKDGSNNHQFVDLYEYFGIYCQPENERFYATKYPNGISYLTSDGLKYAYVDGGLEGKKTVLDRGQCAPPPPIEQTTPEPVSTTSPTPCPCGLFSASVVINSPDMLYTQLDGCRANVTCFSDLSTLIVGKWGEIPKPDDASDNRVFAIETYIEGSNHKWIDLYEYFGIQCQPENGKFYVTKYPNGITYASGGSAKNAYTNGELDGKKTEIFDWRCGPPS